MKRKGIIIAIAVFLLLMTPFAVKAATDGEVDLYAMIFNLETRVDEMETENKELQDRVAELEGTTQEPLTETTAETTTEIIVKEPTQEPAPVKTTEPTTTTTDTTTITTEPEPVVETEPIAEPEPVNPYANVTLSGVNLCTVDGVVHFSEWLIKWDDADVDIIRLDGVPTTNGIESIDWDKNRNESELVKMNVEYTITPIYVDPLLKEMVAGKTFGSRTEAINYIESKIAE